MKLIDNIKQTLLKIVEGDRQSFMQGTSKLRIEVGEDYDGEIPVDFPEFKDFPTLVTSEFPKGFKEPKGSYLMVYDSRRPKGKQYKVIEFDKNKENSITYYSGTDDCNEDRNEDNYGLLNLNRNKIKNLDKSIRSMSERIGTGLGDKSAAYFRKLQLLKRKRKQLETSLFSEEDSYTAGMGGSPGMSSVGQGGLGANTNRGLTSLSADHHRKSIDKIKKHLRSEDVYGDNLSNAFRGLSKKSELKTFKVSAPKGLAEKVRRFNESLKNKK